MGNIRSFRATANDILNQVGVEIGLDPSNDPYSSTDQTYRQMTYLLDTCGQELCYLYPWNIMTLDRYIDTTSPTSSTSSTATYDLPIDFLYHINQTGWASIESRPLRGPATEQEWAYLRWGGFNKVAGDYTYKLDGDFISITPNPDGAQLDIYLTYQSRNWVKDSTATKTARRSTVGVGADIPYFDSLLLARMLKLKILEARGFDTTKAQADFNQMFQMCTARDKDAPVLNAGHGRVNPYFLNVPESGYGS